MQDIEAEALLNRDRYRRLDNFLAKHGQVIRVAPDSICGFLHGKAGVIELADGRKLGFIGSMNETSSIADDFHLINGFNKLISHFKQRAGKVARNAFVTASTLEML
jgi:hypothetical protein